MIAQPEHSTNSSENHASRLEKMQQRYEYLKDQIRATVTQVSAGQETGLEKLINELKELGQRITQEQARAQSPQTEPAERATQQPQPTSEPTLATSTPSHIETLALPKPTETISIDDFLHHQARRNKHWHSLSQFLRAEQSTPVATATEAHTGTAPATPVKEPEVIKPPVPPVPEKPKLSDADKIAQEAVNKKVQSLINLATELGETPVLSNSNLSYLTEAQIHAPQRSTAEAWLNFTMESLALKKNGIKDQLKQQEIAAERQRKKEQAIRNRIDEIVKESELKRKLIDQFLDQDYQDYYELLGVSQSATSDEINKAARNLHRQLHPDVFSSGITYLENLKREASPPYLSDFQVAVQRLTEQHKLSYMELRTKLGWNLQHGTAIDKLISAAASTLENPDTRLAYNRQFRKRPDMPPRESTGSSQSPRAGQAPFRPRQEPYTPNQESQRQRERSNTPPPNEERTAHGVIYQRMQQRIVQAEYPIDLPTFGSIADSIIFTRDEKTSLLDLWRKKLHDILSKNMQNATMELELISLDTLKSYFSNDYLTRTQFDSLVQKLQHKYYSFLLNQVNKAKLIYDLPRMGRVNLLLKNGLLNEINAETIKDRIRRVHYTDKLADINKARYQFELPSISLLKQKLAEEELTRQQCEELITLTQIKLYNFITNDIDGAQYVAQLPNESTIDRYVENESLTRHQGQMLNSSIVSRRKRFMDLQKRRL